MEDKGVQLTRKRLKPAPAPSLEDNGATCEILEKPEVEIETNHLVASEEMELHISHILEKIDNFTHLVSELLESGKTNFKELSNEFEERMITIHKEQIEKWQDEIKQLRLLDASNQDAHALLHNARFLLQNAHIDS
ncbi:knotted 1-binding protein [Parasponia andersonii]|uniref:Knotted 1-binding protein n=1 Tax=Parasponia andersonii TaxID=3476 RepID=A0A2P5B388_PARAD|nr:knotted 1-binding protein [Parasponia andersonii]